MNAHTTPGKEPVRNLFEPPVDWTWHQTATARDEATGTPTARPIRKNGDRPSKQTHP
jgi:hypothetical protein